MERIERIKTDLRNQIIWGTTIDELKVIVRELEQEQLPNRKGGRPLGVTNGSSHLLSNIAHIRECLLDKIPRGDIAESLTVSRQTLNEFIKEHLPEYHKARKG